MTPLMVLMQLGEKEAEVKCLKNQVPHNDRAGVPGCVNNLPVNLAQELRVYSKILDALGEEKVEGRVEEACKR